MLHSLSAPCLTGVQQPLPVSRDVLVLVLDEVEAVVGEKMEFGKRKRRKERNIYYGKKSEL